MGNMRRGNEFSLGPGKEAEAPHVEEIYSPKEFNLPGEEGAIEKSELDAGERRKISGGGKKTGKQCPYGIVAGRPLRRR